jgi:hypothetical protein
MALPYFRISFLTRKIGGLRNSLAIPSKVKITHSRRYPYFSNYNTDHCEAEVLTIGPKVLEGERRLVSEPVIKTCTTYHKKCAKPTGNFLPKRVIDLGPAGAQVLPRLYETKSSDSLSIYHTSL